MNKLCNVVVGESTCTRLSVAAYRCKIIADSGEEIEEIVNVCDRHQEIIKEELKLQDAST